MDFMLWICAVAGVAVLVTGWFLVVPLLRGDNPTGQRAKRRDEPRDRPSTTGGGTAFGRLSTIR